MDWGQWIIPSDSESNTLNSGSNADPQVLTSGILECYRPEILDNQAEKARVLCDAQLLILRCLAQSNVFGNQVLQKHVTK